jgi:hypothetical protein
MASYKFIRGTKFNFDYGRLIYGADARFHCQVGKPQLCRPITLSLQPKYLRLHKASDVGTNRWSIFSGLTCMQFLLSCFFMSVGIFWICFLNVAAWTWAYGHKYSRFWTVPHDQWFTDNSGKQSKLSETIFITYSIKSNTLTGSAVTDFQERSLTLTQRIIVFFFYFVHRPVF